jgi:hypothetical protein
VDERKLGEWLGGDAAKAYDMNFFDSDGEPYDQGRDEPSFLVNVLRVIYGLVLISLLVLALAVIIGFLGKLAWEALQIGWRVT